MSKALLSWYDSVHRTLPWRVAPGQSDRSLPPYYTWLSEIMLQQTQVVTVIEYFNRFVERFPTVEALAAADEETVFKLWEGLGYYSRARNLLRCAREVVSTYGGVFPDSVEALKALPGIGPYTAGAIASIAYGVPAPAVDGNVIRVISRVFAVDTPVTPKHRAFFEEKVMAMMTERPGDFNQALMELGATVCTPRRADCHLCPLAPESKWRGAALRGAALRGAALRGAGGICCASAFTSEALKRPVKPPKAPKQQIDALMCVVRGRVNPSHMAPDPEYTASKLLVTRGTEGGLLKGLWGFPVIELVRDEVPALGIDSEDFIQRALVHLEETYGLRGRYVGSEQGIKHVFTHKVWHPLLLFFESDGLPRVDFPESKWVAPEDMDSLAMSVAMRKQIPRIGRESL